MRTFSTILAVTALAAVASPALSQDCGNPGEFCINETPNLDGRNSSGEGVIACLAPDPDPPDRKVEYDYYYGYFGYAPRYSGSNCFTCPEIQQMSQTVYDQFCP
jgi:hypothetical protein